MPAAGRGGTPGCGTFGAARLGPAHYPGLPTGTPDSTVSMKFSLYAPYLDQQHHQAHESADRIGATPDIVTVEVLWR